MLFQCWVSVEDADPTLKQHWVKCPVFAGTRRLLTVVLMMDHRLERRPRNKNNNG